MRTIVLKLTAVAAFAALAQACTTPMPPTLDPSPVAFTPHSVVAGYPGSAFLVATDVVGDATEELIGTAFVNSSGGPGYVSIFEYGGDLDTWTRTDVVTPADGIRFPHEPEVADIDGDGDQDMVIPGGFFSCAITGPACGSLTWFEQTPGGWVRHDILGPGYPQFFFRAILTDVDLDGILDIVTVGETISTAKTFWLKGTATAERFESTPRLIGGEGGSLPVVADVDGDGDEDVVSPQLFSGPPSYVWYERTADPSPANPNGVWVAHSITSLVGGGFGIERIPDLLGDGIDRWVGTNHVNTWYNGGSPESGVFLLDPGADPTTTWGVEQISTGIQARDSSPTLYAPGLFGWGDIDGDGETDLAVSGDGDHRVFWLQQQADDSFNTYVVDTNMGQAGGGLVRDFDGDGNAEVIFSSYERGVINIYEAQ